MRHPVLSKAGRSSSLVTRAPRAATAAVTAAMLLAAIFAGTTAAPLGAAAAALALRPPASELTPLEPAAPFGRVLAISGDTAAVTGLLAGQAVVFVFVRGASGWAQQAHILDPAADAGPESAFGNALALSGDTLAVGAGTPSAAVGYVNVYVRAGGAWSLQAHLQPPRAAGLGFGASVALAGDSLVAGVPGSAVGHDAGTAYVYARQGVAWRRQAILAAEDPVPDDGFGRAVGVAHQHVVVGGHGFAEIFDRPAGAWRRAAVLASTGAGFGSSVAASLETVAVGDPEAQRVTLFIHGGGQWSHQADLTPPDAAAGEFGSAVSLSQDALAVGAPGTSRPHAQASGAVYVFVRLVHRWRLGGTFGLAAPAPGERFGGAVAVSLHTALAGSKGDADVPTSAWALEGLDNP